MFRTLSFGHRRFHTRDEVFAGSEVCQVCCSTRAHARDQSSRRVSGRWGACDQCRGAGWGRRPSTNLRHKVAGVGQGNRRDRLLRGGRGAAARRSWCSPVWGTGCAPRSPSMSERLLAPRPAPGSRCPTKSCSAGVPVGLDGRAIQAAGIWRDTAEWGPSLLDGDDRGVRACGRGARPNACDPAEGRLGGLAGRAAGCGGVVVPAVGVGDDGGADGGGLGAVANCRAQVSDRGAIGRQRKKPVSGGRRGARPNERSRPTSRDLLP
jgi:hypothetical protein